MLKHLRVSVEGLLHRDPGAVVEDEWDGVFYSILFDDGADDFADVLIAVVEDENGRPTFSVHEGPAIESAVLRSAVARTGAISGGNQPGLMVVQQIMNVIRVTQEIETEVEQRLNASTNLKLEELSFRLGQLMADNDTLTSVLRVRDDEIEMLRFACGHYQALLGAYASINVSATVKRRLVGSLKATLLEFGKFGVGFGASELSEHWEPVTQVTRLISELLSALHGLG